MHTQRHYTAWSARWKALCCVMVAGIPLYTSHAHAQNVPFSLMGATKQYPNEPMTPINQGTSISAATRGWTQNPVTIDCGCTYSTKMGSNGKIVVESCGYANRTPAQGVPTAQWTRVIPLEHLALGRDCASGAPPCHDGNGHAIFGAACCAIVDPQFKRMANDVWDWAPMANGIVADRGDAMFGIIPSGVAPYGNCPLKIDPQQGTIEPVDREKGVVARVFLYFADQWGVPFTPSDIDMYKLWNQEYPPTQAERQRAAILNNIQHKTNPYYKDSSLNIEQNITP